MPKISCRLLIHYGARISFFKVSKMGQREQKVVPNPHDVDDDDRARHRFQQRNMTRRKAVRGDAPSMIADPSNSLGMVFPFVAEAATPGRLGLAFLNPGRTFISSREKTRYSSRTTATPRASRASIPATFAPVIISRPGDTRRTDFPLISWFR